MAADCMLAQKQDNDLDHDQPQEHATSRTRWPLSALSSRWGHALKLKIIAEGVETRGQMDFLRAMGCDFARGYYIGHAIMHEKFFRLLQT